VRQFNLYVSADASGESWTQVVSSGQLIYTSNSDIWLGPQAVGIDADNVRRVKMRVVSNWGGSVTGLQEVSFVSRDKVSAPVYIGGVPVSWILQYWATTNDYLASVDDDEDGLLNSEEYFAATIPDNSNSVLAVQNVSVSGGNVSVAYQNGGPEADVYIEYRPDLAAGDWIPVYTNAAPDSPSNLYIHVNSDDTGFYRVKAKRP
jgi:hypothetical protein